MLNVNYIYKCSFFDPKIGSKRCSIASLCRLPIPSADEFEFFLNKLNLTMESITQKSPYLKLLLVILMSGYQNGGRIIR